MSKAFLVMLFPLFCWSQMMTVKGGVWNLSQTMDINMIDMARSCVLM
jgi:hypothetical protein